ncbi:MAG TPA: hypothetical protein VOA80_16070 [Thermoanaerobaculia bacterium]|nr:hypothetical protein [Thermoanaerobaculia bacterium]
MQILFDKGSTQVQVHIETGHRLVTLFQAIKDQGWDSAIGPDRITRESLEGVNCLVILTRHRATAPGYVNPFPGDWDFAFMESELKAILDFNMAGGGLLLISNHGPFAKGGHDFTTHDRVLAAQFGVTINPAAYQMRKGPLTMTLKNFDPNPNVRANLLSGVDSIKPHNSCAISAAGCVPLSAIPDDAVNVSPTFPDGPAGQAFALVVAPNCGQIIVAGNSGIAGDADSDYPAKGMIEAGSNLRFLIDALNWVSSS